MLFHTWIFAVFIGVFLPVHLALRRTRFADAWLLCASYVFYAWWNPLFLLLIVTSTAAVAAYDPPTLWDFLDGEDPP